MLVSVAEKPLTLVFAGKLEAVKIETADGGLTAPTLSKGGKGVLAVALPGIFAEAHKVTVTCTVDRTWPDVKPREMEIGKGASAKMELPVAVDSRREVGSYTLSARLAVNGKTFGLLQSPWRMSDELALAVEGIPLRAEKKPAVKVTVRNFGGRERTGVVRFRDRWFAPDLRPLPQQQAYQVPAGGTAEVLFPLPRDLVNPTSSFEVLADLEDASGIRVSREEKVSFLATEKAPGPITVDGDLADWHLEALTPVPFERELVTYGKKRNGDADASGVFYTRWDENNLYFAAVLKDDKEVVLANDVGIWEGDSFMFGLYPWGVKQGEALHAGSYREHLGPCKDGIARIFRLGAVSGGLTDMKDAKIAVKRTKDGWIFEWAYPKSLVAPLDLRPGGRFRLSLVFFDKDDPALGCHQGGSGGLIFGGFNSNVRVDILKWPEFVLVK